MGAEASSAQMQPPTTPQAAAPKAYVTLHLYDFLTSGEGQALNGVLRQLGTGAFHCGVEVYGKEWSFRGRSSPGGSGVFWIHPKSASKSYRESVQMGKTSMSEEDVQRLLRMLMKQWPSNNYDILKRNCCHFSDQFCQRLGVGNIPTWITNLANTGKSIEEDINGVNVFLDQAVWGIAAQPTDKTPSEDSRSTTSREVNWSLRSSPGKRSPVNWNMNSSNRGAYGKLNSGEDERDLAVRGMNPSGGSSTRLWLVAFASLAMASCLAVVMVRKSPAASKFLGQTAEVNRQVIIQASTTVPTQEAVLTTEGHYDCEEAYSTFRSSWTLNHRKWCCRNSERGCHYDCANSLDDYASWSEDKQVYCSGSSSSSSNADVVPNGAAPVEGPGGGAGYVGEIVDAEGGGGSTMQRSNSGYVGDIVDAQGGGDGGAQPGPPANYMATDRPQAEAAETETQGFERVSPRFAGDEAEVAPPAASVNWVGEETEAVAPAPSASFATAQAAAPAPLVAYSGDEAQAESGAEAATMATAQSVDFAGAGEEAQAETRYAGDSTLAAPAAQDESVASAETSAASAGAFQAAPAPAFASPSATATGSSAGYAADAGGTLGPAASQSYAAAADTDAGASESAARVPSSEGYRPRHRSASEERRYSSGIHSRSSRSEGNDIAPE